jgi:26S proteasome non-ATPase regulatory subunit 5
VVTGMVARPWFLMEICSKQEIINIVTDANTETTKIGLFSCLYVYNYY